MAGSYPTPQVIDIHAQLPDTRVEASISTTEYARSSNSIGIVFRRLDAMGAGEARCDTGFRTSNMSSGTTTKSDDRDS